MDVIQFNACVTCTATRDEIPVYQAVPALRTFFIYSNINPNLMTFLRLILGTKVHQSLSFFEIRMAEFDIIMHQR
jgi:hypothetical protein